MDRLPPHAAKLLTQLRDLDDPTPRERLRADAGVRSLLAAHKLRNPPALPAPARSSFTGWPGATWKLSWGSAALGALIVLGIWAGSALRSSPRLASDHAAEGRASLATVAAATVTTPTTPMLPPLPSAASPAATSTRTPERLPPRVVVRPAPPNHEAAAASLAEELRFIASVDADIRAGSFDRALRRLARNKAPFQLQEERSAMRVLAACGRDHDRVAARARDQFLKHAPTSILAARVHAACRDVLP